MFDAFFGADHPKRSWQNTGPQRRGWKPNENPQTDDSEKPNQLICISIQTAK